MESFQIVQNWNHPFYNAFTLKSHKIHICGVLTQNMVCKNQNCNKIGIYSPNIQICRPKSGFHQSQVLHIFMLQIKMQHVIKCLSWRTNYIWYSNFVWVMLETWLFWVNFEVSDKASKSDMTYFSKNWLLILYYIFYLKSTFIPPH